MKPIYCPECKKETNHEGTSLPVPSGIKYPWPNQKRTTLIQCKECKHLTLPEEVKPTKKIRATEEVESIQASFIQDNRVLVEQILTEDNEIKYAIHENGKVWYDNHYYLGGVLHEPIRDEEVTTKKILLPSKAEEYGSNKELDEQIDEFIKKWLDIGDKERRYCVLNIRKSWLYDKFYSLNYPRALGEHGTGKSRFLDTIGLLHYKPIATSGALTSAVMFRIINKWKGTLIIDEADQKQSDETNDIIKIINQGYEKGRCVMRCNKEEGNKIEFFDTYCPKVIATRKQFWDKATESRCMTTVMRQTTKDMPPNLDKSFFDDALEIRNKLLMWRFHNYYTIDPEAGNKIKLEGIEPRLKQVNTGFISLFADDPKEVEDFLAYLKEYQKEIVATRSETFEGRVVEAMCHIILAETHLTATNIIAKAELQDKQGKAWTPRRLSSVMKVLGFAPAIAERHSSGVIKIYRYDDLFFENLVKKYVFDDDLVSKFCNPVTDVTVVTDTGKNEKKEQSTLSGCLSYKGYNGYTVTDEIMEKLVKKIEQIGINGMAEATLIDSEFPVDVIQKARESGLIFESKPGFYSLV